MAVAHSPGGQVLCPTDRVTIHAISEENVSALLLRKPKTERERERTKQKNQSIIVMQNSKKNKCGVVTW